ncbi:hypothetical protein C882_0977 [Caenispirillum salinarum AK4]|uniref:Lipoprotein n=1 Tax=Caenispirillum salinarum AK4 TaxID=1238182 RepID=K9HCY7_9PROT|nr:hypothetical protein [Caenispirillum salinarum]EKV28403.1 hypothetical protein C882_0977 [Caenispirillum salinarum AK4]
MSASVTLISAIIVACGGGACAYTMADGFESVEQCRRVAPMIAGMSRANSPVLSGALTAGAGNRQLYFECVAHGPAPADTAAEGSGSAAAPTEPSREVVFRFSTSERLTDQLAGPAWED